MSTTFKTGSEGFGLVPNLEGEVTNIEPIVHHIGLGPHLLVRIKDAEIRLVPSLEDAENILNWAEEVVDRKSE